MGRRRINPELNWLPPRVYKGRSAYEYRPKDGGVIRLASLKATAAEVIARHAEAVAANVRQEYTVALMISEFFNSEAFRQLKLSSQKKYQQNAKLITSVFGKMKADKVKPEHVRQYLDKRGSLAKVAANRELSFFARVYAWAYERGKVNSNPCRGVRKFTETSRDRYITDDEYQAVYKAASPDLQVIMEISYCCAARIDDVLTLTREQIRPEGIFIEQGKTGAKQIKQWTPRLKKAYEQALTVFGDRTYHVILNSQGSRMSYRAFRDRWALALELAIKDHPAIKLDFTFHDIKAKSISDWNGDKKQFSGHKSDRMIATYDRKTAIVPTHE
ncbi:tyrosine-type recombinase/integrase [Oceanobacter mangrovi]|uniref:tyrosine-type recombinase/integrase n=1 Tax=Oceanobacter mangrovi TaxID=2862510 RepID=UPI001C8D710C|nr:tyrosine-type recombinase/integrase [Oceanobacter mangrovi]